MYKITSYIEFHALIWAFPEKSCTLLSKIPIFRGCYPKETSSISPTLIHHASEENQNSKINKHMREVQKGDTDKNEIVDHYWKERKSPIERSKYTCP